MNARQYSVRELKRIIEASSKEFQPVFGKDVERDNKKINDKAYKDSAKKISSYEGDQKKKMDKPTMSFSDNLGMQDLEYQMIDDNFKKKVKSQLKGFTSAEAEKLHKNDPYGNADFTEIEGMDTKHQIIQKGKETAKQIGLTSSQIDAKAFKDQTDNIFDKERSKNESKMYRIKFKNTTFMTEQQMLSKIPDDFKVEGRRFTVTDKSGTEYMVEWSKNPQVMNLTKINEQRDRINHLFTYKSGESKTTNKTRLTEDTKIQDMLDKTRKLMK